MACAKAGDLRGYLDGEMAATEMARIEAHLVACARCRGALEAVRTDATFSRSALDAVVPAQSELPHPSWSRIRDRARNIDDRPVTTIGGAFPMFRDLWRAATGSGLRLATSSVLALVVVSLLFTLSPVQTAAGSFLSLFRVKKFVAVAVDPSSLPNLVSPDQLGSFTITGNTKPRMVTPDEAAKETGIKVPLPGTLPKGLETVPKAVTVTGPTTATFMPDIEKVRAYLSTIGAANVRLPDNLNGAVITVQVPAAVTALYLEPGGKAMNADGLPGAHAGQQFLYVGATTSPTMSVPDGLDVELIRNEVLKIPGLPPDLVNQIRAISDWRNTVVVPVVKGSSREVSVQGQTGLLIAEASGQGIHLVWQKDGIVYAMTGSVSEAEMLAAANSIR